MPRMLVVATLACGLAFLVYMTWPSGSGLSDRDSEHAAQDRATASSTAASIDPRSGGPAAAASPRFRHSEWGYRWDASKPGIAASEEDAAWLQSKGFPGPDVEAHLMRLSLPELEALAARGNQPATAIYAYRLAQAGASREQVLAVLDASAADGSVYALKMAGDIFFTVDRLRDPVMARVYYGLQGLAGDQSGIVQGFVLANQLDQDQRMEAGRLRRELWEEMTASSPNGMDGEARPGYDTFAAQWANLAERAAEAAANDAASAAQAAEAAEAAEAAQADGAG